MVQKTVSDLCTGILCTGILKFNIYFSRIGPLVSLKLKRSLLKLGLIVNSFIDFGRQYS